MRTPPAPPAARAADRERGDARETGADAVSPLAACPIADAQGRAILILLVAGLYALGFAWRGRAHRRLLSAVALAALLTAGAIAWRVNLHAEMCGRAHFQGRTAPHRHSNDASHRRNLGLFRPLARLS